ncbi:MAG TPA: TonB-dependent receptor [Vicinamibacterales bacterium]|jgi:outer membrane receptor protein involved in Fe transport|nr:TonB-dependent receptor [Vicinamibacterales bacterium]
MGRNTVRRFAFAILLIVTAPMARAQNRSATVSGLVKDGTGAVLPGASVTVRAVATNQSRHTITDDHGRYAFPNQDLGPNEITAELPGFQPARVVVELTIGQNAQLDLTLAVGALTESVNVSAGAPGLAVETRSSTFGQLVSRAQIESLPLNGRDFSQLILLQPGTSQARSDVGDILTGKGSKVSVHGARTAQNAYMLDGTDILDALGRSAGSAQGIVSGIESVQEFTVLTNTYSAEYGRAAGGVFNIATKSGANATHGSLFEYWRNARLDATNFFDVEKPPFNRNQYGGSLGGPITRDKAFFFGAFEGLREHLGLTLVEPVPSLAARRGAFLPAGASVNPAVVPYLELVPLPTIDNAAGEKAVWQGSFNQQSRLDTYNVRADVNLSQKDSLFARYTQNDSDLRFINAETFPNFPNTGRNNQKFLTVSPSHIFSNNVVNNLRFAFNRTTPVEQPAPINGYEHLAFIPGQIVGDINISGYKRFGSDRNTPRSFFQNAIQIADDLTVVRGAHALKFGGNIQHFDIEGNSSSRNRGEFTINTFSDFLQGRSRDFSGLAPGAQDTLRHHTQWLMGFYAQDDWRPANDLTLNLGLRYEFVTTPNEVDGKITNVRSVMDPTSTLGPPLFKNPTLKNFAPRAGFAYSPGARNGWLAKLTGGPNAMSIRGGAGLYFEPLLYSTYGNMTFKHEPFFKQVRINNAPFPNVYPLLASGQGLIDTFAIQYDPKSTYVAQYNVNVQRSFSSKLMVTVGYVGSRGVHLWREADINNAFPLTPDGTQFAPVGNPQRRNPNFANIRMKLADGESFYKAALFGVQTRLGARFRAQLSYTYAKSTDDQSSALGRNEFANGQARTVDPYNTLLNRGRSDFDIRHNLSINFTCDLPYGLQVSGIFTAQSGIPVSPIYTFDNDRDATTDNEQRPNWAPGVTSTARVSDTQLFDPGVFVLPPVGSRGNVGRNVIDGPGLVTFDPAFVKSFFLDRGSKRSAQLRIEMFNAFNRVNFAIPTVANLTVFNSPTERNATAGQITSTSTSARQVQLALRVLF